MSNYNDDDFDLEFLESLNFLTNTEDDDDMKFKRTFEKIFKKSYRAVYYEGFHEGEVLGYYEAGQSPEKTAEMFGLSVEEVARILRRHGR
jgi:hypothetical protein